MYTPQAETDVGVLTDVLSGPRAKHLENNVERRLVRAAMNQTAPRASEHRTFLAIEGGTLHRFEAKTPGITLCKMADDTDRLNQCTACALPHKKNNAMCWGASRAGPPPAVLKASPGQLFDIATGAYLGRFHVDVVQAWPRSRFVQVNLTGL
jgi:hypothetical protein